MAQPTAEMLGRRAVELQLITDGQLADVWGELRNRNVSADDFLRVLVRRELLTNYQVERMMKGEVSGYYYGQHKVLYLVGTGTFSRVYRCEDTDKKQIVAVKVLRHRFSEDRKMTEQFFREGEMGMRLRHPNIVPIFEVKSKGLTHYLVMEFIEGRSLREFVKTRKKVPPLEATRLIADVAAGLSYAFVNGVSHRDLKMTNVLVSSRGQPKLVDFGLANAADDDQGNARTIDYAGLERSTGVKKDDSRSDIFFLGCMYYNLLCGKPPLSETKDRSQRLAKARYTEIPPIHRLEPEIPVAVAQIVNKSMEINPDRRYQTPAEMLVELKMVLNRLQAAEANPDQAIEGLESHEQAAERNVAEDARRLFTGSSVPSVAQRTVMVVESNAGVQDALRTGLKRVGYRVLLISDPKRAISRFENNDHAADCVVFSTGDLGEEALTAFNEFGSDKTTRHIPAVLLLGGSQADWKSRAMLDRHRILVDMPIRLKEFRIALAQLMPPKEMANASSAE